jgi:hypothetical protein
MVARGSASGCSGEQCSPAHVDMGADRRESEVAHNPPPIRHPPPHTPSMDCGRHLVPAPLFQASKPIKKLSDEW